MRSFVVLDLGWVDAYRDVCNCALDCDGAAKPGSAGTRDRRERFEVSSSTRLAKNEIRTCLFAAGVACFLFFFFFPKHYEYLNQIGWTRVMSAYFLCLAQSYRRKATMYTRGGLLDYTKQPFLYKSPESANSGATALFHRTAPCRVAGSC